MIGYTITGYDISFIKFTSAEELESLPTNVKPGSIAVLMVPDSEETPTKIVETPYVFWDGKWNEISAGSEDDGGNGGES